MQDFSNNINNILLVSDLECVWLFLWTSFSLDLVMTVLINPKRKRLLSRTLF